MALQRSTSTPQRSTRPQQQPAAPAATRGQPQHSSTDKPVRQPITVGLVRFSYLHVFEPTVNKLSGKTEYSVSVLVPKDDEETLGRIEGAIQAAIAEQWGDNPPPKLNIILRDGDVERPNDPAYAGHMYFNAKAEKYAPEVVDKHRQPILNPNLWNSGDYGYVNVTFYPFTGTGKGVAAGLNAIMFCKKGPSLGGARVTAASAFGAIDTSQFEDVDDNYDEEAF